MSNENLMVKVSYKGFFDDGSIFIDQQNQPIEFPCIPGWMPPVFIETLRDMSVGETRCARVGADEAYEERTDERLYTVSREKIPSEIKLVVGEMVNLEQPDGQTFPARLIELTEEHALFDMNHDAICKALNFEFTLLEAYELPGRQDSL